MDPLEALVNQYKRTLGRIASKCGQRVIITGDVSEWEEHIWEDEKRDGDDGPKML